MMMITAFVVLALFTQVIVLQQLFDLILQIAQIIYFLHSIIIKQIYLSNFLAQKKKTILKINTL